MANPTSFHADILPLFTERDIHAMSKAFKFITEPKVHATELRCYMRDPDGYLIEVGQTTMTTGLLDLYV
jgi:hypothetical protein